MTRPLTPTEELHKLAMIARIEGFLDATVAQEAEDVLAGRLRVESGRLRYAVHKTKHTVTSYLPIFRQWLADERDMLDLRKAT